MNTRELFEIKRKFLMTIPHPKLILKQINRLDPHYLPGKSKPNNKTLEGSLLDYIDNELNLKLSIANAKGPVELKNALISLSKIHNSLIAKLASYADDSFYESTLIKMSEPFDAYAILKNLNEFGVKDFEIKKYLRAELDANNIEGSSIAGVSVLRAKKIENYG